MRTSDGSGPVRRPEPALDPAWTLHGLVERQVAATPDVVALRCGGVSLTYRELDGRANALAVRLAGLGVGLESRVGVFADRSVDAVVALLGVLKAGGAYVPIDPRHPADRIGYVLGDAGVIALTGSADPAARSVRPDLPFAEVPATTGAAAAPPPRSRSVAATSRTSSTRPGRPGGRRASRSSTGTSSPRPPPAGPTRTRAPTC